MRNSIDSLHTYEWASQIALVVKKLPANTGKTKDMGVQSLGWGDPLQEGMATHSSILAWRILWTEELGGLQSIGSQRDRTEVAACTHTLRD